MRFLRFGKLLLKYIGYGGASIINLLTADNTSTTGGTVFGYPSEGTVFGSELITNGDFSSGTTDWVDSSAGELSVVGGVGKVTRLQTGYAQVQQILIPVVDGCVYAIKCDLINPDGLDSYIAIAGGDADRSTELEDMLSVFFTATVTGNVELAIGLWTGSGSIGQSTSFDNVTMKQINPQTLLDIPAGYPRMEGGRWVDTVAGGAALGSEAFAPTVLGLGWVDNGGGSYSFDGSLAGPTSYMETFIALPAGSIAQVQVVVTDFVGSNDFGWSGSNFSGLRYLGDGNYLVEQEALDGNLRFFGRDVQSFNVMVSVKQVIPHWSDVDADGRSLYDDVLGGELWDDTPSTVQSGWVDNGDGTYTGTAASGFFVDGFTKGIDTIVSWDVIEYTSGSTQTINDTTLGNTHSGLGSFYGLVPTVETGGLVGINGVAFTGVVSNVSVKEVIESLNVSLLVEDAVTNKCTCVKANPTATTNITAFGDVAAVFTVVDDLAELALAGLDAVCNGNVYKMDNTLGVAAAYAVVQGTTGNTNLHCLSGYLRTTGGTAKVTDSDVTAGTLDTFSVYTRDIVDGYTPADAGKSLTIMVSAGAICYFILPQLEENSVATSVVIGDDTAASASRDADVCTVPTSYKLSAASGALKMVVAFSDLPSSFPVVFALSDSPDDELLVFYDAGIMYFKKRVSGVTIKQIQFAYTPTINVNSELHVYYGSSGMGIRAFDEGDVEPTFITDPDTTDAVIASTMNIGSARGASIFPGLYDNNNLPKTWVSAEEAGWL